MWHPEATATASHCTHSTGTSGALTWRHRNQAEIELINRVFASHNDRRDAGLVLAMRYNRHGMSLPIAGRSPVLPAGLTDDIELSQLIEMLDAELTVLGAARRATTLHGQAEDVAVLAQALLEKGRAQAGRSIERVVLGGRVNRTVAALVALAFPHAVQIERYSLSEVLGGASRVVPNSFLRLDDHVIGEVVSPDGSPTPPGSPGELTLTELFPLVQLQPLIRYRTGDIVEAGGAGDLYSGGFRWLGRYGDCLPGPDGWLLRMSLLLDWLAERPSVARLSHRPNLRSVVSLDVSEPCLRVSRPEAATVEVLIGLRTNPWLDEPAAIDLVSALWTILPNVLVAAATSMTARVGLAHVVGPVERFDPPDDQAVRWLQPARLPDPPPTFMDI